MLHSSIPWCPRTRGSTQQGGAHAHQRLDGTFLIQQNRGEMDINSLNTCLHLILNLMSLDFVIIKKGEIVDAK